MSSSLDFKPIARASAAWLKLCRRAPGIMIDSLPVAIRTGTANVPIIECVPVKTRNGTKDAMIAGANGPVTS